MKKLALLALIMVLGLGGCASSGLSGLVENDWTYYCKNPGGYWNRESLKMDWANYLKNPGGYWTGETLKDDWTHYLKNPGGYWDWETLKKDWTEFWM